MPWNISLQSLMNFHAAHILRTRSACPENRVCSLRFCLVSNQETMNKEICFCFHWNGMAGYLLHIPMCILIHDWRYIFFVPHSTTAVRQPLFCVNGTKLLQHISSRLSEQEYLIGIQAEVFLLINHTLFSHTALMLWQHNEIWTLWHKNCDRLNIGFKMPFCSMWFFRCHGRNDIWASDTKITKHLSAQQKQGRSSHWIKEGNALREHSKRRIVFSFHRHADTDHPTEITFKNILSSSFWRTGCLADTLITALTFK